VERSVRQVVHAFPSGCVVEELSTSYATDVAQLAHNAPSYRVCEKIATKNVKRLIFNGDDFFSALASCLDA
jgi:hypothetical protein